MHCRHAVLPGDADNRPVISIFSSVDGSFRRFALDTAKLFSTIGGTIQRDNRYHHYKRKAQTAVYDWEHIASDIKPRTDGTTGEYETRKYMYERLSQYNPDSSYWKNSRSETSGWPSK